MAGKVHVFAGALGTGKTTISLALAAIVTTGGQWPGGTESRAGDVVIWSGEDDPKDMLIPRLMAAGADIERVYFVSGFSQAGESRAFDPAKDIEHLRHELAKIGDVRLLIVDPIVSAIQGDSHKNAEVRRGLQPLADLAAAESCAVLGITHLTKGTKGRDPVERLTGSLAFGAVARVVLMAAKPQEQDDERDSRLFMRAKSNIGPDDGGYEYDLNQLPLAEHPTIEASVVQWGAAVEGSARDLLATADATDDDGEKSAADEAAAWLIDELKGGPVLVADIKKLANDAGLSWRTVERAKGKIGAKLDRESFGGKCRWCLPILANNDHSRQCRQAKTVGEYGEYGTASGEVTEDI